MTLPTRMWRPPALGTHGHGAGGGTGGEGRTAGVLPGSAAPLPDTLTAISFSPSDVGGASLACPGGGGGGGGQGALSGMGAGVRSQSVWGGEVCKIVQLWC